jgi:alpha-N-acetylglucosaminidase
VASPAAAAPKAFDPAPAKQAIARLAPQYAGQISVRALPSSGKESFEISGTAGRLEFAGTSPTAITSAFDHYLRHVAHGQVSWNGDQLNLGPTLPAPAAKISKQSPYKHRYMYNFTQFGYTSPYWDWPRWQREIDLLAAKGMNLVLVTIGQEALWYDTFREFGYSDEEIRQWIVLPGHQPWQWMANMSSFGGPISKGLIERRAALGRKIIDRMRSLGMTPVLPGFAGMVPGKFAEKNPGAKIVPQGDWVGFDRPDWLDPSTEQFSRVAAAFYKHQKQRFGLTGAYAADILHEGGQQGDVDIAAAARGIFKAMQDVDPASIWVLQAWQTNPRKELVEAVDKNKLLVLDINADNDPRWSKTDGFWGAPWAWGVLQNGGGRNGVYGNLAEVAETLPDVLHTEPAKRGRLEAIAVAMEGTSQNPVVLDLIADMIWRDDTPAIDAWIDNYTHARYGTSDPDAKAAWAVLRDTAYGSRRDNVAGVMGSAESLFTARPSLTAKTASTWGPPDIRYDPEHLDEAWRLLLRAGPRLATVDTYRYDLVDLTRQALANRSRDLLPKIKAAYDGKNLAEFTARSNEYLALMDHSERVLKTRADFLLGPWLNEARRWGADPAEKDQLEWDARTLVTVWGTRKASDWGGLHDYSNRDWSGLMKDFYRPRWAKYFGELTAALQQNRAPAEIDWFAWEDAWTRQHNKFAAQPAGDPYRVAQNVARAVQRTPVVTLLSPTKETGSGQQFEVTTRFANWKAKPATDVALRVVAPFGWKVEPLGPTTFASVPPLDGVSVRWRVTVAPDAGWDAHELLARAVYRAAGKGADTDSATVSVRPDPEKDKVQPPYATHATTEASFAQSGDRFAIFAQGRDLGGWLDEKGVVYRKAAAAGSSTVVVKLASEKGSGPVSKAGIVVANDVTAPEKGGYAVLGMSAGYGLEFMWDGNGDGKLDGWAGGGASYFPAWLKLVRAGGTYTAFASEDGHTWKQVGVAQVPSAQGGADAGMFASAVNLNNPGAVNTAMFEGFSVS